jgi:catechol 2,3-dioxygenase-like lactoylglutathione lyase family enzyme
MRKCDEMSTWTEQAKQISAITLFVDDLAVCKEFYGLVFGLPVYYEDGGSAVFKFGSTLINLLQQESADELITPARVADKESGSRFQFTITVAGIDDVVRELEKQGISFLNGPMDRPWGIRTAAFSDPAGHVWELAE